MSKKRKRSKNELIREREGGGWELSTRGKGKEKFMQPF